MNRSVEEFAKVSKRLSYFFLALFFVTVLWLVLMFCVKGGALRICGIIYMFLSVFLGYAFYDLWHRGEDPLKETLEGLYGKLACSPITLLRRDAPSVLQPSDSGKTKEEEQV